MIRENLYPVLSLGIPIPKSIFKIPIPSTSPGDTYFVSILETVYTWASPDIAIPRTIFKTAIPSTIPRDTYT
jgi:hypothetical protein